MSRTARCLAFVSISMAIILAYSLPVIGQGGEGRRGGRGGEAPKVMPTAPPLGFTGSNNVAAERLDPAKLPIIGAWRINFDKSDPALKAQGRFKDTGTTIYTAVNGGIKTETFLFYPPKDDSYKTKFTDDGREYWFKLDGQSIYKDPQGPNGLGQTVAMWIVDRNTLARLRSTKGVVDERVLYRVSPDGKTLVWDNFTSVENNPGRFVWDRIELPKR
jgi:hypothetical protein